MIALETIDHEFGLIRVQRSKRTREIYFLQGGCYQSRCDMFGVSLVPYIHAMFHLLLQAQAQTVLMVGCGGGSLGTMLARRGVEVMIVDINKFAFDIARRHFQLPAAVECQLADGADFLTLSLARYDAIVMDAYCGGAIPAHLSDASFFKLVASCLHENSGVFLANVHYVDDDDVGARRFVAAARKTWAGVRLLDTPGAISRNAVLLAGDIANLGRPALVHSPLGHSNISNELSRLVFV